VRVSTNAHAWKTLAADSELHLVVTSSVEGFRQLTAKLNRADGNLSVRSDLLLSLEVAVGEGEAALEVGGAALQEPAKIKLVWACVEADGKQEKKASADLMYKNYR
jgi:hypothetical protein